MAELRAPQCPYKPFAILEYSGIPVFHLSGEIWRSFSRGFAPTAEQCCERLVGLRQHLQWSRTMMAAFMGVNRDTIRRWEEKERMPNAAARRLIWLVDTLAREPERLKHGLEMVFWGQSKENLEFGRKIGLIEPEEDQPTAEQSCESLPTTR